MSRGGGCSDAELLGDSAGAELWPVIIRLLAEGLPVPPARIASTAGVPSSEVDRLLHGVGGTEWDEQGRLIGLGLTLRPTPHRFHVDGRCLYTWCATDTLLFATLLAVPAVAESSCPATGSPIRVELEPGMPVRVAPATAVVSQLHNRAPVGQLRAQVCEHGHFFASSAAASSWRGEHRDGVVLTVADAVERCRATCAELGWTRSTGPTQ